MYNEERNTFESSSSEYSTEEDDDEQTGNNDSTGVDRNEGEVGTIQQNAQKFSEKPHLCEGVFENSEKDAVHKTLNVLSRKPVDCVVEENDSENEGSRKVEVLPSLLFSKQNIDGKKLVEVIAGDEDGNNTCLSDGENANFYKNRLCQAVEPEKSVINEGEKEVVLTKEMESEKELSCEISRLLINE